MAIRKIKSKPLSTQIPAGIETFPSPILIWDSFQNEIWGNIAYHQSYGDPENLLNHSNHSKVEWLKNRPVQTALFSQTGRYESYLIHPLKPPADMKVSHYPILDNPNTYLIEIDQNEMRNKLQEQLIQQNLMIQSLQNSMIQSAKLASLGEFSSGLAHELNQPLQAMMGFSQELESTEQLSAQGKEFLKDIIHSAKKMADIIKTFRRFARDSGSTLEPTSIEKSIEEAMKIIRHPLLEQQIEIEFLKPEKDIPEILANPIQLEQVLINLFSNARDALKEKSGPRQIQVTLQKNTSEIRVKIRDNGSGIKKEHLSRIFDPFFTTKPVGEGTGLGLSLSYGMIRRFHGVIHVESDWGIGTTFHIIFPKNTWINKGGPK